VPQHGGGQPSPWLAGRRDLVGGHTASTTILCQTFTRSPVRPAR
jgi:hypothetical protein